MYRFDVRLHRAPAEFAFGRPIVLAGSSLTPLECEPRSLGSPFDVSFEQAAVRLQEQLRMFFEPDGAFAWTGTDGGDRWRIEGCLYDRGQRLIHVDLAGECPPPRLDELLAALGWPETPLAFALRREGIVLSENDFRRWAGRGESMSAAAPR